MADTILAVKGIHHPFPKKSKTHNLQTLIDLFIKINKITCLNGQKQILYVLT